MCCSFQLIFVLAQLICFVDGKGGSSTDVNYVQVVTVGSQFANSETIFKCSFPKLSTPDELFWFFGEDMIWSNKVELKKKYKTNGDFTRTRKHTITITNTKSEDNGSYKCVVRDSGNYYEAQVIFAIKPDVVTVKPASITLLKCSSKEFLQNTYWTKGYSLILNDQAKSNVRVLPNGVLQIMNFTADNVGTYVCFSEGKKMKSCQLSISITPVKILSPLRGWRGILFGIVIGVLIVSLLFAACFIQYAPMDAIKYRRAKKRELKVRAEKETLN